MLSLCCLCVVLCCLVLPCLVSCLILVLCLVLSLSCLVLSCLVLSCLVLSCVVLPCLVLPCLVVSCRVVSYRVVSRRVVSCRVLSCLVLGMYERQVTSVRKYASSSKLFENEPLVKIYPGQQSTPDAIAGAPLSRVHCNTPHLMVGPFSLELRKYFSTEKELQLGLLAIEFLPLPLR
jgi:ASC-1-like (ASCH) protein